MVAGNKVGGSGGEPEHGTGDDKRYEDLPDCVSHELLGKPPPRKRPSIGAVLVDLLGVKADYELLIAKTCGASYVKHSHAKDTAVCHDDLDDGDGGVVEQP
eukprot:jgi/Tetstr1/427958/TSEL_018032.t1